MRRRGASSTLLAFAALALVAGLAIGTAATYILVYTPEVNSLNSRLSSLDDELSTLQSTVSRLQTLALLQASNNSAFVDQLTGIRTRLSQLENATILGNIRTQEQVDAIQAQLVSIQKVLEAIQEKVGAVVYPPSVLTSTGFQDGTRDDYKHKVFFAAGRVWAFYQDASGLVGWKSSSDGSTWSAFTSLFYSNYTVSVSDGTDALYDPAHNRVWVVSDQAYANHRVLFWYGTPGADGSIVWSGGVKTELLNFTNPLPAAAIDTSGVMWNTATPGHQYNANVALIFRNGTWVSTLSLPSDYIGVLADLVPATGGKMFAILGGGDFQVLPLQIYYTVDGGKTWSGPIFTVGSYNIDSSSAVSVNDTLYVAGGAESGPVLFTYHLGALKVGPEVQVDSVMSDLPTPVSASVIATDGSHTFFLAYTDGTNVFFRTSSDLGNTWSYRSLVQTGFHLNDVPFSVSPVIFNSTAAFLWETTDSTIWIDTVAV